MIIHRDLNPSRDPESDTQWEAGNVRNQDLKPKKVRTWPHHWRAVRTHRDCGKLEKTSPAPGSFQLIADREVARAQCHPIS